MSRKEGCGAEENVRIVQRILKCEISISAASREMGVGWETIHRWMARYEAEREAGLLRIVRQGGERGFHGHGPARHGKGVLAAALGSAFDEIRYDPEYDRKLPPKSKYNGETLRLSPPSAGTPSRVSSAQPSSRIFRPSAFR